MNKMIPIAYWRNRKVYTRMIGSKCKDCGAEFFPPVRVCKKCGSRNIEEKEMPRTGTLLAYTKLSEPAQEFKEYAPIYLGFIRLDNGVNVISMIADADEEKLKSGSRVQATVRKWTEDGKGGLIYYGYKFRVSD